MDPIKQDIFSLDLLVCDGHQTLKIDYGGVDNVDSMAQTQWVSNISLQKKQGQKTVNWTNRSPHYGFEIKSAWYFWCIEKERKVHEDRE